jgi:hypothetical protein
MFVYKKFAIRSASLVEAKSDVTDLNPQARQITLRFRAADDGRSSMKVIMTRAEAELLMRQIEGGLASIAGGPTKSPSAG